MNDEYTRLITQWQIPLAVLSSTALFFLFIKYTQKFKRGNDIWSLTFFNAHSKVRFPFVILIFPYLGKLKMYLACGRLH
jgi:hypothetical protein